MKSTSQAAAFVVVLSLVTACSRSAQSPAGTPPVAANAQSVVPAGNVCDRQLLTMADLGGIFDDAFTATKSLQGDAQTCYFVTAAQHRLRVTLRLHNGRAVIGSFTSGRMNEYAKWQPLAGVGEEAIWKPDLSEVSARSGDVLCEVGPEAGSLFLAKTLKDAGEPAVQQKLGAVCNTVFARSHLAGAKAANTSPSIGKSSGGNVVEAACEKDIAPIDVAGIITAPVVKQAAAINPQSCSYHAAAGATVTISLAQGEEARSFWDLMTNPANAGTLSPLAGAGDTAMHARGGTFVIARKGNLVCSADVTGTDNADGMQVLTKARGADLAQKLGALCAKVFATRGA